MEHIVFFTIFFTLIKQATTWGQVCKMCPCAAPIICPPPVICPTRICPPPVKCPPQICPPCPPPPSCPPPPPCPPSPPLPPPMSSKPIITCCRTCVCYLRRKRDSSKDHDIIHSTDLVCNSNQLMMIMNKKIRTNVTESTIAIKKAADSILRAEFNVFCAINDLTHVAHVESFCQYKKDNIICFAYKI